MSSCSMSRQITSISHLARHWKKHSTLTKERYSQSATIVIFSIALRRRCWRLMVWAEQNTTTVTTPSTMIGKQVEKSEQSSHHPPATWWKRLFQTSQLSQKCRSSSQVHTQRNVATPRVLQHKRKMLYV